MFLPFKTQRGFTLIELVVSVSIMVIVTAIVISNQSINGDRAGLLNLTHDISLAIRQTQVYGISVKEISPGSNDFSYAYGIEFNLDHPDSYVSFYDKNRNGLYGGDWSCNSNAGCLSVTQLTNNNTISQICVMTNYQLHTFDCSYTQLDISFLRPNTNTIVHINGNPVQLGTAYPAVKIVFQSPKGNSSNITIYSTGQIDLQGS